MTLRTHCTRSGVRGVTRAARRAPLSIHFAAEREHDAIRPWQDDVCRPLLINIKSILCESVNHCIGFHASSESIDGVCRPVRSNPDRA